ncbi:MAG: hypothetical protein C5B50_24785 [Verrucomicrobia bacterium]|nr:MAG: hypothetical protein C5B50_24785 [Verrucomicrobiota bacterium]
MTSLKARASKHRAPVLSIFRRRIPSLPRVGIRVAVLALLLLPPAAALADSYSISASGDNGCGFWGNGFSQSSNHPVSDTQSFDGGDIFVSYDAAAFPGVAMINTVVINHKSGSLCSANNGGARFTLTNVVISGPPGPTSVNFSFSIGLTLDSLNPTYSACSVNASCGAASTSATINRSDNQSGVYSYQSSTATISLDAATGRSLPMTLDVAVNTRVVACNDCAPTANHNTCNALAALPCLPFNLPAGYTVNFSASSAGGLPRITGFSPTNGPVGTVVTITGCNLLAVTNVAFNGTSSTSFNVDSDTQITATVPAGATTGRITATAPQGATISPGIFSVQYPPTITTPPQDQTVTAGHSATFTVVATGTGTLTYSWRKDGQTLTDGNTISGATTATLTLSGVQLSDAGAYSVVVHGDGDTTSSAATLTVTMAPCAVRPAGLVAWWRGEGNAADSIGGHNGTLRNGAAFASGLAGQAFALDGFDDYVDFGAPSDLLFRNNSFSVESWVNFTNAANLSDDEGIVSRYGNGSAVWLLGRFRNGVIWFALDSNGFWSPERSVASPQVLSIKQWHHLAGVYDHSSGDLKLYVDGQLNATASGAPFTTTDTTGGTLSIGTWYNYNGCCGSPAMAGLADEVALYNRALTAAEVQGIYDAGASGKCGPPMILTQPQNVTRFVGQSATFSVVASGDAPLTYNWQKVGGASSLGTASSLTLNNLQLANAGTYFVTVANSFGSAVSQPATLTVLPCPPITLSPATLPDAGLSRYSQTISASGGTAFYSFAITSGSLPDRLTLSTVGTLSGTPTALSTNIFTITATDTNGCTGSATYTLAVSMGAVAVVPAAPSVVVGGSVAFTLANAFPPVTFSLTVNRSGGSIVSSSGAYTAGPNPNTADTVRAVDANGNEATTTVTVLPPEPGLRLDWFTVDGGGGTSSDGEQILSGTIGQPDAGGPFTNSDFRLTGGFWAAANYSGLPLLLVLNPADLAVTVGGSANVTVSNAAGPATFSLVSNNSGGGFDPGSGQYTAGDIANVTDTIRVVDANGQTALLIVTVRGDAAQRAAWFTIAGGGGSSSHDELMLSGTIGQAAPGGPLLNTDLSLLSGFWSAAMVVETPGAPFLTITPGPQPSTLYVIWPSPSTGFVLQQSEDFITWTTPSEITQDNGSLKFITVNANSARRFFRLVRP